MRRFHRTLVVCLLVPAPFLLAQPAADPSGHWEGSVKVPEHEVKIEIDLAKNGKGDLAGTFGQPEQSLKGLPLSTVAVDGRSVRFVVKADVEPGKFEGVLSADGKSISGNLAQAGYTMPFSLTRTGDARIVSVPKSAAIAKELEGVWNATAAAGEKKMRLVLTMANRPDGTAAGTIVSPDGSGIEIPIAMTQTSAGLTVDIPSIGASFALVLNAAATELAGTWTQSKIVQPVTFRRAAN